MLSCDDFKLKIEQYLNNQLDDAEKEEFLEHMFSCKECKEELKFSEAIADTLNTTGLPDVPEDFLNRVNMAIDKEAVPSHQFSFKKVLNPRILSSLVACLIIAVFLSLNQNNNLTGKLSINNQDNQEISYRLKNTPQDLKLKNNVESVSIKEGENNKKTRIAEDIPSPANQSTNENNFISTASLIIDEVYSIMVDEKDFENVISIANIFSTPTDATQNSYTMPQDIYEAFIESLKENKIEFTSSVQNSDIVCFTINKNI